MSRRVHTDTSKTKKDLGHPKSGSCYKRAVVNFRSFLFLLAHVYRDVLKSIDIPEIVMLSMLHTKSTEGLLLYTVREKSSSALLRTTKLQISPPCADC